MGRRFETILHRAALRSRREMVEFLVKQRAPQVQDVNGNTPLHCAALGGDPEVARLLLEGGADVEAGNSEGDRPLHLAAGAGNLAVLRLLLQVGVSPIQSCPFLMNRREPCWRAQGTSTTQRSTPPRRMPRWKPFLVTSIEMSFPGRGDERAYRKWPELELFKQQVSSMMVSSTLFESQKPFSGKITVYWNNQLMF